MVPYTKRMIQKFLQKSMLRIGHDFLCPDVYVFSWHSDFVSITKLGMLYEFEIKASEADFRITTELEIKHERLADRGSRGKREHIPNRFFYVVPHDLASQVIVPEYAGLYSAFATTKAIRFKRIKAAPLLHDARPTEIVKEKILRACYYKFWAIRLRDKDVPKKKHGRPRSKKKIKKELAKKIKAGEYRKVE